MIKMSYRAELSLVFEQLLVLFVVLQVVLEVLFVVVQFESLSDVLAVVVEGDHLLLLLLV